MSNAWYLLASDSEQAFEDAGVLSLHPAVSWCLLNRNISYTTLDQYCPEDVLRADEGEFFKNQLVWMEQLDEFIQKNIPPAEGIEGIGRIHINRLKYLIDFAVIQSRYVGAFFDRERPRKVTLIEEPWEAPELLSVYDFKHPLRLSLQPFLEYEARRRAVEFEVKRPQKASNHASKTPTKKSFLKDFALWFGVKACLEKIRYGAGNGGRDKTFLFLDAGTEAIDFLIRQALKRGRVFIKQELEIREAGCRRVYSLRSADAAVMNHKEEVWKLFENGPLMQWIEKYAPSGRKILSPYLRHFLFHEIPAVASETRKIKRFMLAEKVDAVVSRASAGRNYPAALLAAGKAGIPRLCFQHSIGPMDMPDWAVDELAFHDINFAMHPSSREYFKTQPPFFNHVCRVESWSHSLRERAKTKRKSKSRREVIFYVPAKLASGVAHFNTPFFPMTWYFEHQKKILSYFSQRPEFLFVYKHSALQSWAADSVLRWLAERGFSNIEIRTGNFPQMMQDAGRVIFDYPSSGTFESAAAKIPMLALYRKSMRIWPPMRSVFGRCLTPFLDSEDAVQRIHEFLNALPSEYIPRLGWEDEKDPFDCLQSVLDKKERSS